MEKEIMKRGIIKGIIFLLLVSLVQAGDVAYIVRDTSSYDQNFVDAITSLGYDYDLIDDNDIPSNLSGYYLILVGDDIFTNPGNIPVNEYPSLIVNTRYPDDYWGWSSSMGSRTSAYQNVDIANYSTSITDGLPGSFMAYNDGVALPVYYLGGRKSEGVLGLITTITSTGEFVVGKKDNPRRVFYGITRSDDWSSNSEQLFKNAINWIILGQDMDGDGFYTDDDCNDRDNSINPDADEIAYDGIDQDCDGFDLRDLDGDGFDADIVGGNDCNDNDIDINPNAVEIMDDIDQNCVNDAPILLSNIPNLIWNEDEIKIDVYNLSNYFSDYEGDDLSYGFIGLENIAPFIDDSLISLIPDQDWFGNEYVVFTASDGSLIEESNNVSLTVNNVNDAPVLNLNNVSVLAGTLVDLSGVTAIDVDNDELTFIFGSPLNESGHWQTTETDGGGYNVIISVDDGTSTDSQEITINVIPQIKINEFSSYSSSDDWVELYNPSISDYVLDNCFIEDKVANKVSLSGIITSHGFLVVDFSNRLNRDGDVIKLNCSELIIDEVGYGDEGDAIKPGETESVGRLPDGYDTDDDASDFHIFNYPTKLLSNLIDLEPPIVFLLGENIDGNNVELNFSVTDNVKVDNCSLYTDREGWELEQTIYDDFDSFNLFVEDDITLEWNVLCYDNSSNFAWGENNRTYVVEINDNPIIIDKENLMITLDEDFGNYDFDLTDYGEDEEENKEDLIWDIIEINGNFNAEINNRILTLTSYPNETCSNCEIKLRLNDSQGLFDEADLNLTINNVNDKPLFNGSIDDISWDEDTNLTNAVNLSDHFYDIDNDVLTFGVFDTSEDRNITVWIDNGIVNFTVNPDWFGTDWIIFNAIDNDGEEAVSNVVILTVNNVNDMPIIDSWSISNGTWSTTSLTPELYEGNDYVFSQNSSDEDNDTLNVSWYLDNNLVNTSENWTYEVGYNDAGEHNVTLIVEDYEASVTNYWDVTILNVNLGIPYWETNITDQTIDEDGNKEINLSNYATDPDNDIMHFVVNKENTSEVNCEINNNILSLNPSLNWFGLASCEIGVFDDYGMNNDSFDINVTAINDEPVLTSNIPNQNWDAYTEKNNAFDLNNYFGDVDNENLIYNSIGNNNINVDINNGVVSFSQPSGYYGVEYVVFTASDGVNITNSNNISLTVNDVNSLPLIDPIPDQEIIEDSGFNGLITLNAIDLDGSIIAYNVVSEDINKVDCIISDGVLGFTPKGDWYGIGENAALCVIEAVDNDNGRNSTSVRINVTNVNDKPVIDSTSPNLRYTIGIAEDGSQLFNVVRHDIDNPEAEILVEWHVDSVLEFIGNSFTYSAGSLGNHIIKVFVKDLESYADYEWNLTVSAKPIVDTFDGDTTNFDNIDLSNVNLTLEKLGYGKIEFLDMVNLEDIVDFDNFADIKNGLVAIDSDVLSSLKGKKASITLYNLDFEETPVIYYNNGFTLIPGEISQVCPSSICSNINYTDGILRFDVSGFSSFYVGGLVTCSQLGGDICSSNEACNGNWLSASDTSRCCSVSCSSVPINLENLSELDTCEEGIKGNLEVNIKEPDDGDDFKPGEIMSIEVKVKNDGNNDMDVIVEAILYDLDEDEEVIDEESDDIEVEEGKSETFDLELRIPDDIDESNDYILFVKAYEDGDEEENCNEDSIDIDVKREKHDVIIEDFVVNPSSVGCDEYLDVRVDVKNLGSKEEDDVKVEVRNFDLGLSEISNEFELEKYDKDDKAVKRFTLKIPEDAEDGIYNLEAIVTFDSKSSSETEVFNVQCMEERKVVSRVSVVGLRDELISLGSTIINVEEGKEFSIPVIVKVNEKGRYSLDVVNIVDWAYLNDGEEIILDKDQSTTFYLYIEPREGIIGKRSVTVNLMRDGKVVDSKTILVDIKKVKKAFLEFDYKDEVPAWLWVLFDLLILVLMLLLFVGLLFRRRY